jgi:hypothetical protein
MILNDHFYPIDARIGFIKGEARDVVHFFSSWQKRLYEPSGSSIVVKKINGSLSDALTQLLPLTAARIIRDLFVPTKGKWVAYFNNGRLGTDLAGLSVMAKGLKTRAVEAAYQPEKIRLLNNEPNPHGGALTFVVYDSNNAVRYIGLINEDGRWSFEVNGKPFAFEKTSMYQAERIKDRFNLATMVDYLMHLGIDILNENFYLSNESVLVERVGLFRGMREYTLEEALDFR